MALLGEKKTCNTCTQHSITFVRYGEKRTLKCLPVRLNVHVVTLCSKNSINSSSYLGFPPVYPLVSRDFETGLVIWKKVTFLCVLVKVDSKGVEIFRKMS